MPASPSEPAADADPEPDTDPDAEDGADAGRDGATAGRPCPACGTGMVRRHCKYVCPRHGVVYDCSDTFW